MKGDRDLETLANLSGNLELPHNFFKGCDSKLLPEAKSLLVFSRRSFEELQPRLRAASPHPRYVLMVNLKTAGAVNVDGRVYPLKPGEAFLVFPYQLHNYLNLESDDLLWTFVTFESNSREALQELKNRRVELGDEDRAIFGELVGLFLRWQRGEMEVANEILINATLLLDGLRKKRERESGEGAFSLAEMETSELQLMGAVNRYLETEDAEKISVEAIAETVGISERGLRDKFLRDTGFRIGDYIRYFKMNRAMRLLA
ncbi:MAG: AraC family transcriptional regulator, partial [Verrucomicrobiota bacterium]